MSILLATINLILAQQATLSAQDFGVIRYCNYALTSTPTKIEEITGYSTKWSVTIYCEKQCILLSIPEQFSKEDLRKQLDRRELTTPDQCKRFADAVVENIKVPFPVGRTVFRDIDNSKSPEFTIEIGSLYDGAYCTHNRYGITVSKRTGQITLVHVDRHHVPTKEVASYKKEQLLEQVLSKSPAAKVSREWIEWGYQQPRSRAEEKLPSGPMVKLYYLEVVEPGGKPRVFTFRMNGTLVGDSADLWWLKPD